MIQVFPYVPVVYPEADKELSSELRAETVPEALV